jgi:hypothetical protein
MYTSQNSTLLHILLPFYTLPSCPRTGNFQAMEISDILLDAFLATYLLCIAAYSIQLLLLEYWRNTLPECLRVAKRLRVLPIASLCLSVAIVTVLVVSSATDTSKSSNECADDSEINADIGGIGVLLGLFVPSGTLMLVLFSGHWKAETSGAKELCVAQMASMFCTLSQT